MKFRSAGWMVSVSMLLALVVSNRCAAQTATVATPQAKSATKATVTPVPRDGKWMDRHNQMNVRVKQGNVDLLFIGDSITQGWEGGGKEAWKEFYGNRNAVNLGIGGDRTQHVIWRLQNGNINGISPKLAVLMIGTNNSGGDSSEDIADGIKAIVNLLRAKTPTTKILILAIFPRNDADKDPRHVTNVKANGIVCKLADGNRVLFQDIGKNFLKEGKLTKDVMPDLLHLTPAAYKIWAESIEPTVAKIVGPK